MEVINCSKARKNAIMRIIQDMFYYSKKKLPEHALEKIVRCLAMYEVEKGVSVFMSSQKPNEEAKLIAKIDTDKEILYLWWSDNAKKNNEYTSKAYSLGMTFKYKSANELAIYSVEDWQREFPDFAEYIADLKGHTWKIKLYSKAGILFDKVSGEEGIWLVQDPANNRFIPNRPVGKVILPNELHIFQPNPNMKKPIYERLIKIE